MKQKKILLFSLFLFIVLLSPNLAASIPQPPQVITGSFFYVPGNPIVPPGVTVIAEINGTTYWSTVSTIANKYYLNVPSDDPDTPQKEGGASGDVVEISFNDFYANESVPWYGAGWGVDADLYIRHPPALASIGNKTVNESEALTFAISATDMDNDTIAYSASSLPAGATLGATNGTFSWTPSYEQAGNYTITFTASDGDAETVDPNETITIAVNNVNRAPVAANSTITTDEDLPVAITLSATDADGDPLTYAIVSSPAHGTLSGSGASRTYTPNANYNGADSFTFKANDGTVDSNIAIVNITVSSVNDAPVLSSISDITVNELESVTIPPSAADVDNATLNYYINDSRYSWNGTSFIWATTYTDAGAYSVKVTASDGALNDTRTLKVTVNNVNRAPVFSPLPENITFDEDTTQFFNFSEYLSDPDGDALDFVVFSAQGNVTYNYTTRAFGAPQNWNGTDYVRVTATDGMNDTSSPDILMVVNPVNDAPLLASISGITATEHQNVTITPSATDADNASLIYSINDTRFSWNGTSYVWSTNYNDTGVYSILVTASDGALNSTQAVRVTVSDATQTFTKNLFSGWNLVSVPVETENTTVESVLASISGNYTFLAAWDGSKKEEEVNWITYDPLRPAIFNTLKNINTTTGFWVFMASNSTLNITGKIPYRTNVTLYGRGSNPAISGWNLVGYALLENTSPDTALAAVKNKTNVVFGNFEQPNYWESYSPDVGGTMGVMKQGYGYWIRANTTEDATLEYMNA